MDIDIPIKALMNIICYIIAHANYPDSELKTDILLCEIMVLKRFFPLVYQASPVPHRLA